MKKFWKDLPTIAKAGILIGGGLLAYRGIKRFINKPAQVTLPQGGSGLPVIGNTSTGAPVYWNPAELSKDLYNAMSGLFTLSGTKDAVWNKLADLPSGDMVTAVYNYFNKNYGGSDTLTQWIKDEYYYDITGSGREKALNRLSSLNLA